MVWKKRRRFLLGLLLFIKGSCHLKQLYKKTVRTALKFRVLLQGAVRGAEMSCPALLASLQLVHQLLQFTLFLFVT